MRALVLVSFSTFHRMISGALAAHILWQRMSCLHPFLLAALTMIISEKAASRGGTFQKSLTPPFSPTCLGCLNIIDSGSRHQTTQCLQKAAHNLQCHIRTYQSHNPARLSISWGSPLHLPTTLPPGGPPSPRQRLPSCPGTRF